MAAAPTTWQTTWAMSAGRIALSGSMEGLPGWVGGYSLAAAAFFGTGTKRHWHLSQM